MTTMKSYRLRDDTVAAIVRMSVATSISQAEVIADAVFAYERSQAPPAQKALLDLYDLVSDAIQTLQNLEEQRPLETDEQEVLDFLNRVWDEARNCKLFIEPKLEKHE